jgi:uncharacterized protein YcaQ
MGRRESLSIAEARRLAISAQGLARPRPEAEPNGWDLRRVIGDVGLLQIDSVNVLERAHYLPAFSRLGPYRHEALDRMSRRAPRRLFEYWGHEASLLPVELYPLLRWRMDGDHAWGGMVTVATGKPDLLDQLREAVRDEGPVTLAELEHLGDAIKRGKAAPGNMWNWSDAKKAVEWLFWRGEVSAVRNPATFGRHYVSPERVLPAEVREAPVPSDDEAMKALLMRAARSHGVGMARCLADYYRLNIVTSRRLLAELAGDGALREVEVEGWRHPAFLHPEAQLPRWIRASALLSPFDSLVWQRERTEALFDFRYRIEIYTPADKRVHGYYVLPFLLGDRIVGRVDLKADRPTRALLVQGAYAEPGAPPETAVELAAELWQLAGWLGLDDVVVAPRGDLAAALAGAVG